MTEYKCKRGFKIDVPEDKCDNEELVYITEPEIRAFCAFCGCGEAYIGVDDEDDDIVVEDYCEFLRADLSWDGREKDMYEAWGVEE